MQLLKSPVLENIDSLEEYTPENVEKLADVFEKFSQFKTFESVLCEKLFSNAIVVLLKSTLDGCCCEINKMRAAIDNKINHQQREESDLNGLIRHIQDIVKNYCEKISDAALKDVQQRCEMALGKQCFKYKKWHCFKKY